MKGFIYRRFKEQSMLIARYTVGQELRHEFTIKVEAWWQEFISNISHSRLNYFQSEDSMWWCSRLRSTILAKILASSGAVAAAAAARRTLAAPAFCIRLAWWMACLPPGIVNCTWMRKRKKYSRVSSSFSIERTSNTRNRRVSNMPSTPEEEQMQHMPWVQMMDSLAW